LKCFLGATASAGGGGEGEMRQTPLQKALIKMEAICVSSHQSIKKGGNCIKEWEKCFWRVSPCEWKEGGGREIE
jgi:hypothetical protein